MTAKWRLPEPEHAELGFCWACPRCWWDEGIIALAFWLVGFPVLVMVLLRWVVGL